MFMSNSTENIVANNIRQKSFSKNVVEYITLRNQCYVIYII